MYSLIIFLPTIIAFVFMLKFFMRAHRGEKQYLFLGLFNFLFVVILVAMNLVSSGGDLEVLHNIVDLFSLLFYVAILAIPATFYLYTISLSNLELTKERKSGLLKHYYLPLLLLVINVFSFFYLSNAKNEEEFAFQVTETVMNYSNFIALLFVFPILNCLYIYKTIKKYRAHKQNINQVFSYKEGVDLKWMLYYILGYCLFIMSVYLVQGYSDVSAVVIPTSLFLTAYLVFVGVLGSSQKQVVFDKNALLEEKSPTITDEDSKEKSKALKEQILQTIAEDAYLNKSLTIHEFSKLVGSNSKYISTILNNEFQQNFSTFINSYRISKAKEMLTSEMSSRFTIETIGEEVGFRSKSAFNSAFKAIVGLTPSQYRNNFFKNQ